MISNVRAILKAHSLQELEDLYLPYKARRKTRADLARDKGLEPLAQDIFKQKIPHISQLLKAHQPFISG